jgi:hypothetical protein
MLLNKQIPSSYVTEIRNMVEYIKKNNIFKYEGREFSEECPAEILKNGCSKATILVLQNI